MWLTLLLVHGCGCRVPLCRVPGSVWLLNAIPLPRTQYLHLENLILVFWVSTYSTEYAKAKVHPELKGASI